MKHSVAWGGVAIVSLCATFPCPSSGQTDGMPPSNESGTPPAQQLTVTPSGVDMRTQRYIYSRTDIAIGSNIPQNRLNLHRTTLVNKSGEGAFGSFDTGFLVQLLEKRIDINGRHFDHGTGNDYRVTVIIGGTSDTFQRLNSNSGFTNISPNKESTLSINGDINSNSSTYTYISADGTEYNFRNNGSKDCSPIMRCSFAENVLYPEGTKLEFSYANPSGELGKSVISKVESNFGYNIVFEHSKPGKSVITKACLVNLTLYNANAVSCSAGAVQVVNYDYSAMPSGRLVLTKVSNVAGVLEKFSYEEKNPGLSYPVEMSYYSGDSNVAYLKNSVELFQNDDPSDGGREAVTQQKFADGSVVGFEYTNAADLTANSVKSIVGGTYTNSQGTTTVEYGLIMLPRSLWMRSDQPVHENVGDAPFQLTEGPVRVVDTLGRETSFNYCDPVLESALPASDTTHRCVVSNLQSTTDPSGKTTHFTYDGAGRIIKSRSVARSPSGLADIIAVTTYAGPDRKTAGKPLTVTDPLGNKTINSYDSRHGGLTKIVMPPVGGVSTVKRFSYQQRTAWVKNGGGGYSPQSPIWLLIEERFCRTTATNTDTCAGGSSDEIVTRFDYGPDAGPNNLFLRGVAVIADGRTERTCYDYDAMGNRVRETRARAGLTTCS